MLTQSQTKSHSCSLVDLWSWEIWPIRTPSLLNRDSNNNFNELLRSLWSYRYIYVCVLLVVLFCSAFWDRVLLCRSDWPWIHCVAKAVLRLVMILLPSLLSVGITGHHDQDSKVELVTVTVSTMTVIWCYAQIIYYI